ncbi:MAG: PQQ-binding-like beta-propeller repeat protein [Myxococcales bacterium]|nr:PQQ-binding-like beta-propeller repeat protein [Myxococcales bacterium]
MTRLRLVAASDALGDSEGRAASPATEPGSSGARLVTPPGARATERPSLPTLGALGGLLGALELPAGETGRALLGELAFAVADLCLGRRARALVLAGERREIGLERVGPELVACVYRAGVEPEILWREGRMPAELVRTRLVAALGEPELGDGASRHRLAPARAALASAATLPVVPRPLVRLEVASPRGRKLTVAASLAHRPAAESEAGGEGPRSRRTGAVARADLHALLWRGEVTLAVGESERRCEDGYPFLLAEGLVLLASAALEACAARRPLVKRVAAGVHRAGLTLDREGRASLLVAPLFGAAASPGDAARGATGSGAIGGYRLPAIDATELARAACAFARALCRKLAARDRSLFANLRFVALGREAASLGRRLSGASPRSHRINAAPESYRAFASSAPGTASPAPTAPAVGRLRFSETWRAEVPAIDLRSVFVCGDRLVVGSGRELCAIERTTGALLWRTPSARAASVLTAAGLVRIAADGAVSLVSLADGSELFALGLAPCSGASTSAAVVSAPGLPRLLLVSEGTSDLCAVDLDGGEVRWRRRVRRGRSHAPLRLRRAGKLVVVSSGEPELCAFDVVTGDEVWSRAETGGHVVATTFDGGELFAVRAARARGRAAVELEHIDAWTGAVRWSATLPRAVDLAGPPLVARDTVLLPTYDDGRVGFVSVRRDDGALACDVPGGVCEAPAGWLVVDDAIVANSEQGELAALDAADGRIRYRHLLAPCARLGPGDRPENLRPVLRSGALFVPQAELYVMRPRDGAVLGTLEPDLVPDVTRVDERCGVYVAELSGHLAAFAALPSLQLVSPLGP